MKRILHVLQLGCLSMFALWLCHNSADAQYINPYSMYVQNQVAQNNMYMQRLVNMNSAAVYGTNYGIPTYASQVSSFYGPGYGGNFYSPYAGAYSPAVPQVDPYGGGGGGYGNPYMPNQPGYGLPNPYNPYNPYSPYGYGGYGYGPGFGAGQYLQGSADVMRSYGQVINQQEQARVVRETALQAKLETRKKAFELEMYIKANTPTYTQEQERVAKTTLRRIQSNSLPGEVVNGKSLNYLLEDLGKHPNKKIALEPLALSEGVLSHLNVTNKNYGLGVLRNDGKVQWPIVLQESMSVKQRKDLDEQLQALVKGAYKDQLDANLLKNVRTEMDKMRDDLVKRVNETPTSQYLEAKRFLQEFHEASVALENKVAPLQAKFQRFVEGGKSVQEVADYMIQNGLRFGPATANDEPAYRAAHASFATYDIAMNSALGTDSKDQ